jgi:D-alanyl-D-alanine carboxypeptidase
MSRTVYKNASGLPDNDQVTTARDQSILGRAIQERFPKYYKYFSIRSFTFRGQSISNHNHLLGRVDGVDGIKTGYIGASGFNLVTSVHRGNRYLVAVVMGGSSAGSRDAKMRDLISDKIAQASTSRTTHRWSPNWRTVWRNDRAEGREGWPKPDENRDRRPSEKVAVAIIDPKAEAKNEAKGEAKPERRFAVASAAGIPVRLNAPAAQSETQPRVAAGSTDPIRPVLVKTGDGQGDPADRCTRAAQCRDAAAGSSPTAAAKPEPKPEPKFEPKAETKPEPKIETKSRAKGEPKPERSRQRFALASATSVPARQSADRWPSRWHERPATVAAPPAAPARTAAAEPPPAPTPAAPPPAAPAKQQVRSGWMIQVGAYQAEQEAKQRLSAVQSKASKVLTGADPFTESVDKGGTTFYRARFAGLDRDQAEAACKYLKRDGVDCVPIKN